MFSPNIIVGSESWLKPDILSSEVFPGGYNVYRKDRPDDMVMVVSFRHVTNLLSLVN